MGTGAVKKILGTPFLGIFLVLLIGFIVYIPTISFDLIWDDVLLVNYVSELGAQGLKSLLTADFRLDPHSSTGYYRPVTLISLYLDQKLGLAGAAGFHLTNILIHLANTVVFFWVISLLASRQTAFMAAALFAVHPANAEAVSFVSARSDMFASVFILAASGFYLLSTRPGKSFKKILLMSVASSLCFMLACLSKEIAFVFPVFLIAYFIAGRSKEQAPARGGPATVFPLVFVLLALVSVLFMRYQAVGLDVGPTAGSSQFHQIINFGGVGTTIPSLWTKYLSLLLFPLHQSAFYTTDTLEFSIHSLIIFLIAVPLLGLLLCRFFPTYRRILILSCFWVILFLLPVGGFFDLGETVLGTRYLYIPNLGACMGIATLFHLIQTRVSKGWYWSLVTVTLVLMITLTPTQAAKYRSERTLFQSMIEAYPDNYFGYFMSGNSAFREGAYPDAERYLDRAMELNSDNWRIWSLLGDVYLRQKNFDSAVSAFRRSLNLAPGRAELLNSLAVSLVNLQRYEEAESYLLKSLEIDPSFFLTLVNLGLLNEEIGRLELAENYFNEAVQVRPWSAAGYMYLGSFLERGGKNDDAIKAFRRAAQFPDASAAAVEALERLGR